MIRPFLHTSLLSAALLLSIACHPGAAINATPQPSVGGTIAGIVRSGANPVIGRKVTAVNVSTNTRFDATTGSNGGYTIKVPEGVYRVELSLQPGESLAKQPDQTEVNNGDLDAARDFEVTMGAGAR